jgi:hypothetical protein
MDMSMDMSANMSADMSAAMSAEQSVHDRLALSRQRLRLAMQGEPAAHAAPASGQAWAHSLRTLPGAPVVMDAVQAWWAQHPLRVVGLVAANATMTALRPAAQRHPLGLVAGALLAGALLAWSRPWRWLVKPALFAGLLPQLFSKTLAQIPAHSWIAVLTSLAQDSKKA